VGCVGSIAACIGDDQPWFLYLIVVPFLTIAAGFLGAICDMVDAVGTMTQAEIENLKGALATEQRTYANHIQSAAAARTRIKGLKAAIERAERRGASDDG
jgi:hypothetical protein